MMSRIFQAFGAMGSLRSPLFAVGLLCSLTLGQPATNSSAAAGNSTIDSAVGIALNANYPATAGSTWLLKGSIDEIFIYNRDMTQGEIGRMFDLTSLRYAPREQRFSAARRQSNAGFYCDLLGRKFTNRHFSCGYHIYRNGGASGTSGGFTGADISRPGDKRQ